MCGWFADDLRSAREIRSPGAVPSGSGTHAAKDALAKEFGAHMSTLLYGTLTTKREQAPPDTSDTTSPPGSRPSSTASLRWCPPKSCSPTQLSSA